MDWLRLWHEMPTDPKWRVIAKASGQPLSLVISLYVVLLVDASKNKKSRGVTTCHDEDLSVTLDCDMSQIEAIKAAMQGRVLDGNVLAGWEERQPKREDSGNPETGAKSAAERKAEQRAREREASKADGVTAGHEASRNVTTEESRGEEIYTSTTDVVEGGAKRATRFPADATLSDEWAEFCRKERPDLNPVTVFQDFHDYWVAVPGKRGTKLDWTATWRKWVRREKSGSPATMNRGGSHDRHGVDEPV